MSWNQGNYIIKGEEVKVKGKVRRKVVTYHSSSVFGGCSDRMIGLCRPQGNVSRYKSINAGESFIPVWDTSNRNLELCSIILLSPRRSFFISSRASAGSSYGWNIFLRASTNSL
jgi:hypothetical protein